MTEVFNETNEKLKALGPSEKYTKVYIQTMKKCMCQ